MADRVLHQPATVYTRNLKDASITTITITDPTGVVVAANAPVEEYNNGLLYTIPIVQVPGIWEVTWDSNGTIINDSFSVGTLKNADMTVWEVRAAACRRVADETHIGYITEATGEILVDETVIGGSGSYKAWWIVLDEPGKAVPRRVHTFSGSGFTVRPRFERILPGTRYLLTSISPHEFDLALATTMSELSPFARIPVRVSGLPTVAGEEPGTLEVNIPAGMRKVHEVQGDGLVLPGATWRMLSGRRILVTSDATDISIEGIRDGTIPVWEDSRLDFDSGAVIARVASLLHASRAAGSTMDEDENLRRQLAAMDEYMELRRRATGRPNSGQRDVID